MASRKEEKEARREERLRAEQAAAAEGRRKRLLTGLLLATLAAAAFVVTLILVSQSGSDSGGGGGGEIAHSAEVESQFAGITQRGTVLGDPKARAKVVEFGDLQCPACKQFSETTIPDLIDGPVKSGDAQLEFRNFTIIGPDSVLAAKGALAASEQDRYWQYIELFYRNQGQENSGYVTDAFITDIARGAGVPDIDAWKASISDKKWEQALADTQSRAQQLGFTGTPSVLVEGPGGSENLGTFPSTKEITDAIGRVG